MLPSAIALRNLYSRKAKITRYVDPIILSVMTGYPFPKFPSPSLLRPPPYHIPIFRLANHSRGALGRNVSTNEDSNRNTSSATNPAGGNSGSRHTEPTLKIHKLSPTSRNTIFDCKYLAKFIFFSLLIHITHIDPRGYAANK